MVANCLGVANVDSQPSCCEFLFRRGCSGPLLLHKNPSLFSAPCGLPSPQPPNPPLPRARERLDFFQQLLRLGALVPGAFQRGAVGVELHQLPHQLHGRLPAGFVSPFFLRGVSVSAAFANVVLFSVPGACLFGRCLFVAGFVWLPVLLFLLPAFASKRANQWGGCKKLSCSPAPRRPPSQELAQKSAKVWNAHRSWTTEGCFVGRRMLPGPAPFKPGLQDCMHVTPRPRQNAAVHIRKAPPYWREKVEQLAKASSANESTPSRGP